MSYQQNNDILSEFREADKLLRETQFNLRVDAESEPIQHIADHMRKWEKAMHKTLEELEEQMSQTTEETFTQATPHGSPVERIRENLPAPEEPADLVNWSLKRHEELAEWCGSLADQSISERTTDVFRTLATELRDINRQLAADTRALAQESS